MEDDHSDLVANELVRRKNARTPRSKLKPESDETVELDLDAKLKGDKWKETHMQLANSRQKLSDMMYRKSNQLVNQ